MAENIRGAARSKDRFGKIKFVRHVVAEERIWGARLLVKTGQLRGPLPHPALPFSLATG
jgi:hypothetical protein